MQGKLWPCGYLSALPWSPSFERLQAQVDASEKLCLRSSKCRSSKIELAALF